MCGKLPPKLWSPGETRRAGMVLSGRRERSVGHALPWRSAQQHQGAAFPPTEDGLRGASQESEGSSSSMGSSGSHHHTFAGGGTVIFIHISQVKLLKHRVNPPPRCTQEPHEDPGPGQGFPLQSQRYFLSSSFSLPLHESEKSPKNSRLTWSRPWRKEVIAASFSHSALVSQQRKESCLAKPETKAPTSVFVGIKGRLICPVSLDRLWPQQEATDSSMHGDSPSLEISQRWFPFLAEVYFLFSKSRHQ